jgi:hypothetical protein
MTRREAYEEIKRLLASGKRIIWFNGKYDYKVFWRLGWPQGDVGNVTWDALLAEHVLEEDKKKFYSLKMLTKAVLAGTRGLRRPASGHAGASQRARLTWPSPRLRGRLSGCLRPLRRRSIRC